MATVCGLPDALSAMLTIAVREPVAVGENVALIWQLVPAPSDFPTQLSDSLKSPAFAPVTLTAFIVSAELPEFVTVIVCEALLVPTLCEPNAKLAGET
jgi:hypothetical protein